MERFKSTGLIPDDDWANALNNGSFGRLTSSDDFGGWEFNLSDSKYDDFDDEDEDKDEDEEPVTNFRKNKSEAWRSEGIFVDPREVGSRMEDLPCQQHLHNLAEVQRTSALLAKVKETLDTVVRMDDNSSHETAAVKELLVAFRGAFGSAESDEPARKPKDREFINLQRLQDSGSESDSDFDCFAEGKLMPAPPTRIGGRMEIDVAVPGPSSAARPSPPQLENAQTTFLNRLVGMMDGLDERITEFTTEVDKMERRIAGRTETSGQEVIFCGEVEAPPAMPTMTGHKKKKKKKKKKKRAVSPSVAAPMTPVTSWTSVAPWAPVSPTSPPIPMTSSSWAAQPTPGPASNGQKTAAKKRKKSKGVARPQIPQPQPQMLRPPKTAAVSLTAAAGRENEFGRAMARAMSTVKVDELGIDTIRPKRSVTGGLVLEIPGAEAHAKAAALKAGLEKALRGTGVRLSCPQKYAELRIFGLTELATPKSVRKAVAAAGGCEKGDVTVGDLRRDNNGLFSAWARCPVRAAAKLAKDGQVTVHPFVAKVVALAQRPLQCHRCLEFGHVQHRCTSTVDRSNLCYRCGGTSHKAKECLAAPKCPVCADLGVPANHRLGGPACNPPPTKMTGKLESGVAPAQAIPGVLPPETATSKRRKRRALARGRASDASAPSEPPEKRSKISTVARAPLLPTPVVFPSVAAAGAAPKRAALKASSPRACPVKNARTLTEMLGVALRQVAPGTSPSRTIAVVTAAPKAKKLKVTNAGDSVKPPALVVQKDDPCTVAGAAPSVDADPDVSLSVTAAGAAPGRVALQVSPQGVAPATNAQTSDTLALRQEAPGTTIVITTALEPEKLGVENLGVEDDGCAVKPPPLVVQKDDEATVARAAPSVDADSDVSLSVTAADAAPGRVALQVSPQGVAPATNAQTTSDTLALRQEAPGTTIVITTALEPEKLGVEDVGVEDDGCAVKPPPLMVQKDDEVTVARAAPAVEADSEGPSVFRHCIPVSITRLCTEGAPSTPSVHSVKP